MKDKSIGKSIAAIIVGVILYFGLGRYIAISIPGTNEIANIQGSILAVSGVIYGPVVGVITGLVGQLLIEASWFGLALHSYTWSSIVAAALFGYLIGFFGRALHMRNRRFGGKKVILFNIYQIAANGIAWFLAATILNVLIYKQGMARQLGQGLIVWGTNVLIVAVIGTLLLFFYSRTGKKQPKSQKKQKEEA